MRRSGRGSQTRREAVGIGKARCSRNGTSAGDVGVAGGTGAELDLDRGPRICVKFRAASARERVSWHARALEVSLRRGGAGRLHCCRLIWTRTSVNDDCISAPQRPVHPTRLTGQALPSRRGQLASLGPNFLALRLCHHVLLRFRR